MHPDDKQDFFINKQLSIKENDLTAKEFNADPGVTPDYIEVSESEKENENRKYSIREFNLDIKIEKPLQPSGLNSDINIKEPVNHPDGIWTCILISFHKIGTRLGAADRYNPD